MICGAAVFWTGLGSFLAGIAACLYMQFGMDWFYRWIDRQIDRDWRR